MDDVVQRAPQDNSHRREDFSATENGPSNLSKSKKRRLKRKRKTADAADKQIQFVVTTSEAAIVTKPHPSLREDVILGSSKTNTTISGTSSSSRTLNSLSHTINSPISNSKSKPAIDVSQNLSEITDINVQSPSEVELKHCPIKMDAKPSRDEVMAQREAKKLAKSAKKNKSGKDSVGGKDVCSNSELLTKENTATVLNSNVSGTPEPAKAKSSSDVKSGNSLAKLTIERDVVDRAPPESHLTVLQTGKFEKSREEVMAEREAKKLAKLTVKNKKKDPSKTETQADAVPKPKDPIKAEIIGDTIPETRISPKDESGAAQMEVSGDKSKTQLKAERRAKQEAQRAAKEAAKKVTSEKATPVKPSMKLQAPKEDISEMPKSAGKTVMISTKAPKSVTHQPKLLSHLQTDNRHLPSHIYQNVHPAIVELGAKYGTRVVSGSNARCIALLQALKKVIADFVTPREKEFSRAMETKLNDSMAYLNASRQSSVSMTNALKHVKSHLTQLTTEKTTTDDEARRKLFEAIDTFIKEQIDVAGEAICNAIAKKISNGDTIAIYGCSSLLLRILVESRSEGKDFEVVVVDGGPLYEGREMCRRLVCENIKCSYVLLPAFSYIVGQTSKVLLGAHALLANGCVMSRSGTAVVAMLAKAHNVPVIVCCETYKFCERVQADAFMHNELGPGNGIGSPPVISLMYDMTPPSLVDAVATELAILPCTSVPVILRVKPSDVSTYSY